MRCSKIRCNCACGSSGHRGRILGGKLLHWERQSVEHCQCDAREEGWRESRTLGGMRVERPRLVMKLILTAAAQLASIDLSLSSCRGSRGVPGRARRWSGDGGRAVGGEVREESCTTDYAGALFAKQPPQLQLNDITEHCARHIDTTTTMSALPRSIRSRLLAPALRPSATRAIAPSYRAYSTNEPTPHEHKTSSEDAPAVKLTSSSTQIREEGAAEGMRHRPDYNVAIDYRVSYVDI